VVVDNYFFLNCRSQTPHLKDSAIDVKISSRYFYLRFPTSIQPVYQSLSCQVCSMIKQININGTLAIVNPKLIDDFPHLRNKVGIIHLLSTEMDLALVEFEKQAHKAFSSNSLLILRDPAKIRADVEHDANLFSAEEQIDLRQIMIYTETKFPMLHKLAIELALKDPIVMSYTMNTLQEKLELIRDHGYGR